MALQWSQGYQISWRVNVCTGHEKATLTPLITWWHLILLPKMRQRMGRAEEDKRSISLLASDLRWSWNNSGGCWNAEHVCREHSICSKFQGSTTNNTVTGFLISFAIRALANWSSKASDVPMIATQQSFEINQQHLFLHRASIKLLKAARHSLRPNHLQNQFHRRDEGKLCRGPLRVEELSSAMEQLR